MPTLPSIMLVAQAVRATVDLVAAVNGADAASVPLGADNFQGIAVTYPTVVMLRA
jgi:hypothetical protein